VQLQEQRLLSLQVDRQRQDTLVIHQQQHPLQAEVGRMAPSRFLLVLKPMIFPAL
jgi:hypothetical protein